MFPPNLHRNAQNCHPEKWFWGYISLESSELEGLASLLTPRLLRDHSMWKGIGTPRGVHRTQTSQSDLTMGLVFLRTISWNKVLADSTLRNAGLGKLGQSLSYWLWINRISLLIHKTVKMDIGYMCGVGVSRNLCGSKNPFGKVKVS